MEIPEQKKRQSLDLETAQSLILEACSVLPPEKSDISRVVGRVAACAHKAQEDLPGYDGSLRDGYAVGKIEANDYSKTDPVFRLVGEVAAGDTRKLHLGTGEAIRIMTGGLIPVGCQSVIPQENCEYSEKYVSISTHFLQQRNKYIHKKGSEIVTGQVILPHGGTVSVEQQMLLAGGGYGYLDVIRKPRVSFFCTGSELLTDVKKTKQDGQRLSTNSYLLSGLISRHGATLVEETTVLDVPKEVESLMTRMAGSGCDILLSTGGMGPGKFDLIEEAFARCGGQVVYRSLAMRPGKSTLFGKLGNTLFFGLPGPPPAVQLLFHELVRPAINALQGAKQCNLRKIKAILAEDIALPRRGLSRLKSGVLFYKDGSCLVRPAAKTEALTCYIVCAAARRTLRQGEKVIIHLV